MNLGSWNTTADDGMSVQSRVHLSIERVGVDALPFQVVVYVEGVKLTSDHATVAGAKGERARLHALYMEAHRCMEAVA